MRSHDDVELRVQACPHPTPLSNGKLMANDPKDTFNTAEMSSFTSYGRHFPPTVEKSGQMSGQNHS